MAMGCSPAVIPPTAAGGADATFVLENTTASNTNQFTLASTGTVVNFWGGVTISGASSETVEYTETHGLPADGCPVTGGTIVETIAFTFPKTFAFTPNGSYGPTTGLMDTVFSTSTTGSFNGAIYNAGTCTVFSPSQSVYGNGGDSYEYPGGGNTSVPAGSYYLEIWH